MSVEHGPDQPLTNGPTREPRSFGDPTPFVEIEENETVDGEVIEDDFSTTPSHQRPIEILNRNQSLTLRTPDGQEINVDSADFIREVVHSYHEESSELEGAYDSATAKMQEQMTKADYKQLVGGIASDFSIRRVLASRYPGFSNKSMKEQDAMVLQSAEHLGRLQILYQGKMAEVAAINADEAMYHTMAEMFSGGVFGKIKGWLTVDGYVREQMYQKVGNAMDLLLAAKFGKENASEVRAGIELFKELQEAKAESDEALARAKIQTLTLKEVYDNTKASNAMMIRTSYLEAVSTTVTETLDRAVVTVTRRPVEAGIMLYDGILSTTRENFGDLIDRAGSQIGKGINFLFNDEDGLIFVKIPGSIGSGVSNLVKRIATPQVAGFVKWGGFGAIGGYFGTSALIGAAQMAEFYGIIASHAHLAPPLIAGWAGITAGLIGAKGAMHKAENSSRSGGGSMRERLARMRQSGNANENDPFQGWGQ